MTNIQSLNVNLYEESIGTLTLLPGDRSIFAFNEQYLDDSTRSTLSLSFKDEFGDVLTHTKTTQTSLIPFFSNLLPEGHMRDYLAERAGVKTVREFHLIWALGVDLPGAVTVTSADDLNWTATNGQDDAETAEAPAREPVMRFSLAGVQMKFSAVSVASGGLTIPVDGAGGEWIVKLPDSRYERVPENELSMMRLAGLVGIDVPENKLVDPREVAGLPEGINSLTEPAFAIKRFDRPVGGEKIHVEDFAQVFGVYPRDKYNKATYRSIASVLWIETGRLGIEEFVRRLVFNTLIGNADMHLKNWSLIYRDRRTAALAPSYDFVSTIAYLDDENAALKFARTKKMTELSLDELSYLSAKAKLPTALVLDTAKETVARFVEVWQREKKNLPLSTQAAEKIDKHYLNIPLIREV